ncbi:hypothetical protein HMI56_000073 [Coelomomyces lativittatus]|nr:hypothetical protein HMI56_000073 [Coelomomyces lativittatus]
MKYEPVIHYCPEFWAIKSKETCLLKLPVLVNYLPLPNGEWEQCLRMAVLYSLHSPYGHTPELLKTECFPAFHHHLEIELFVHGRFFYEEGDPADILDDYQDEGSEEEPELSLLAPSPLTIWVPLSKPVRASSSSSSSSTLLSGPKDTRLPVHTSWVWRYFCDSSDGDATVYQVQLANGELCNTQLTKDKKTFSTSGMARHLKILHKLSSSSPSVPSPSSFLPPSPPKKKKTVQTINPIDSSVHRIQPSPSRPILSSPPLLSTSVPASSTDSLPVPPSPKPKCQPPPLVPISSPP